MQFVGTLTLILIIAVFIGHLFARFGLPAVMGELITGIILGPACLNLIHLSSEIRIFSNIGVICLMFLAGLESNFSLLKKYWKSSTIIAFCGVILPIIVMGFSSLCFHVFLNESFFIGVIFSTTSVSISVIVLREFNYLNSIEGANILGAAVVDDIFGVLLLSLMVFLLSSKHQSSSYLFTKIIFQILFFVFVYLMIKWLVPMILRMSHKILIPNNITIMAMIICLFVSYLADKVGLSGAIGAFFAGIAVAQTGVRDLVDSHIEPIGQTIFIPVFFVSIGLEVVFLDIKKSLFFIVIMTVLSILTKWLGCGLGAWLAKFNLHSQNIIGAGMVARGEMALITAQIGFNYHLLNHALYINIILVIVLATLVAPIMLRNALKTN